LIRQVTKIRCKEKRKKKKETNLYYFLLAFGSWNLEFTNFQIQLKLFSWHMQIIIKCDKKREEASHVGYNWRHSYIL
jgi:hypothetical protein